MKPVDLVFVVDESGSIGRSNFLRIKNFLSDLVDQLTISSTAFRVGLVKFDKAANTEFQLDRYSQKYDIKVMIIERLNFRSHNDIFYWFVIRIDQG